MPTYTVEDAKTWIEENRVALDEERLSSPGRDVQMFNRMFPAKSRELWDMGCWLGTVLRELGATDEQAEATQEAAGQRAFLGDALGAAVAYANEFAANGDIADQPGPELADRVNREAFGGE